MIEVERHFRPEFLNRLDELVVFNPLTHADLQRIVHLQLAEVQTRLEEKGVTLKLDEPAIDYLITKGFNADYGARPLRRAIERFIEDPLAEGVLRGDFEISKTVSVSVAEDTEGFIFTQEAKEEPAPEPEPEPEPEPATAAEAEEG
jgi:ATP-dependent Clp protease ATP-binding subunit ClpC